MNILEGLEALAALHKYGTTLAAANRLRVSQSAMSKRLAALEAELGQHLTVRSGRHLKLSPRGIALLEQSQPFLMGLKTLITARSPESTRTGRLLVTLGVAESIMATWGASLIRASMVPDLEFEFHTHRGPVVLESVMAGDYRLGVLAGVGHIPKTLNVFSLGLEPMVVIPRLGAKARQISELLGKRENVEVISIETHSGSWTDVERNLTKTSIAVVGRVESFISAAAMSRAGFGHALVPLGVARLFGMTKHDYIVLPGVCREIAVITRPSTATIESISKFLHKLQTESKSLFEKSY